MVGRAGWKGVGVAITISAALWVASPSTAHGAPSQSLTPSGQVPSPVPAAYQGLYGLVAAQVTAFSARPGRPRRHPSTAFGVELLEANGNIGADLLSPGAISAVDAELDAFQALGVRGVTVDVSFPLLLPSTPQSRGYLHFYEHVATQIRRHHMVFSVEENPVFSGTPLTELQISYAGLTLNSYAQEQRQQAQLIIDDLKPRYLSVLTEPDTFADALKIPLDTPQAAAEVVQKELSGLKRHDTEVGAGSGTWSDPAIDQALLRRTSIDYLDVHLYPLGTSDLANLKTDVAAGQAAGLPLVMDETWLNKPTAGQGLGPAGAPQNLKVKSYSFWEPLDERYVEAMIDYARSEGFSYVSFFDGARAFFGYLDWSPALAQASYQSFSAQYNSLVGSNMAAHTVSGTGLVLMQALGAS